MYFESLRLGLQQMKLPSDGWLLFSQRIKKKNEFRFVEPEMKKTPQSPRCQL